MPAVQHHQRLLALFQMKGGETIVPLLAVGTSLLTEHLFRGKPPVLILMLKKTPRQRTGVAVYPPTIERHFAIVPPPMKKRIKEGNQRQHAK